MPNTVKPKKRRATSVSHRYSSTEAKVQLYIAHDDGGSFKRSTRCRPRAQTPQSGWCRSDCAHACRAPCIARPSVLFLRPGSARARARCNKTLPETPAGRRSLARYQTPPNPLTVKIPPRRPPVDGAPHLFRLRWHLNARPFTASTIKAALLDYLSSCKSALMEPP